jgi:hypothetical protein
MKKYINFNGGPWHRINPREEKEKFNPEDPNIRDIDLAPGFFMEGVIVCDGKSVNSVLVHTFKYVPSKGIDKPRQHPFDDKYYVRSIHKGRRDKVIGELYDGGYRKKPNT